MIANHSTTLKFLRLVCSLERFELGSNLELWVKTVHLSTSTFLFTFTADPSVHSFASSLSHLLHISLTQKSKTLCCWKHIRKLIVTCSHPSHYLANICVIIDSEEIQCKSFNNVKEQKRQNICYFFRICWYVHH